MPSSMPAGILTESFRDSVTRPAPWHSRHGSAITWPRPWQVGQVRSIEKKPCEGELYDVMGGHARWDVKGHDHGLVSLVDVMPRMAPVGKTADYAIVHLDADLRWLATTLERVAELREEVCR